MIGKTAAGVKSRAVVAGVLGALVLALLGAGALRNSPPRREASLHDVQRGITATLDTLLVRYGIEPSTVRTWRLPVPGTGRFRVEQRVLVPPSFISLNFNHDFNAALLPLGAHVVATERTREDLVTMHVVLYGRTWRSVAFEVDHELGKQGTNKKNRDTPGEREDSHR